MCIFRFNPPAPGGPCKVCRLCPCVPRYWRVDVPAFGSYPDSWTVLEFLENPALQDCFWDQMPQFVQPAGDFFEEFNEWRLGTRASLDIAPGLSPNVVFGEWVLFKSDEVAFTRSPNISLAQDPDYDATRFFYFDCLGRNEFFYAASDGDHGGEDPNQNGWPPLMILTPYYP